MDFLLNKTRGAVRACSKCGTTLASRIKFFGFGNMHIFCPNQQCKSDEIIDLALKPVVTVVSAAIILFLLATVSYKTIQATRVNCDSFKDWVSAQKTFADHTWLHRSLDRDHDGIACEKLLEKNIKQ